MWHILSTEIYFCTLPHFPIFYFLRKELLNSKKYLGSYEHQRIISHPSNSSKFMNKSKFHLGNSKKGRTKPKKRCVKLSIMLTTPIFRRCSLWQMCDTDVQILNKGFMALTKKGPHLIECEKPPTRNLSSKAARLFWRPLKLLENSSTFWSQKCASNLQKLLISSWVSAHFLNNKKNLHMHIQNYKHTYSFFKYFFIHRDIIQL